MFLIKNSLIFTHNSVMVERFIAPGWEGATSRNGLLHSFDDKPAAIYPDGTIRYCTDGLMDRESGPALVTTEFCKWYRNGIQRRDNDLPSCEWTDGDREWTFDTGKRGRAAGGPAFITNNGEEETYDELSRVVHWVNTTTGVFEKTTYSDDLHTSVTVSGDGSIMHQYDGVPHRVGGPSMIIANGDTYYHTRGELDRQDGPAVSKPRIKEYQYYSFGKLHRDRGPAVVSTKYRRWVKHGEIRRERDRPTQINRNGTRIWTTPTGDVLKKIYANGRLRIYSEGRLEIEQRINGSTRYFGLPDRPFAWHVFSDSSQVVYGEHERFEVEPRCELAVLNSREFALRYDTLVPSVTTYTSDEE